MSYIIIAPVKVWRGVTEPKKAQQWFHINLNNYRNTHFRSLNTTKINYKKAMEEQIRELPTFTKIKVHYTIYPASRRRTDLGNVVSVHKKYFEDALVEFGKIEDDDYYHITYNSESFGGVDKDNPRVEIKITPVKG